MNARINRPTEAGSAGEQAGRPAKQRIRSAAGRPAPWPAFDLAGTPLAALAQAPATGPVILLIPASTRATALGNAWVAGRDEDAQFYNPAQLLAGRAGFNATGARFGPTSKFGSLAGTYAAGPLSMTLGWGVEYLTFKTQQGENYPVTPASLTRDIDGEDASSLLGSLSAAVVWKGFRIGASGKYISEKVPLITDAP